MSIELTQSAAEKIKAIIAEQEMSVDTARLCVGVEGKGGTKKYTLDLTEKKREDEPIFSSQGITITCKDEDISILDGTTIDFKAQEGMGEGFTFDVPNEKRRSEGLGDTSQPPPDELTIRKALKNVIDPEVGVNIIDLGLVYGLEIDQRDVFVTMTMTTPACPMSEMIQQDTTDAIHQACPGTKAVEIELVWEPAWSPEKMNEEGKKQLGWM